jgi:hypothetical protein
MEAAYDANGEARRNPNVDHFEKLFDSPQLSFLEGLDYKQTDASRGTMTNITCSPSGFTRQVKFRF